MRRRFNLSLNLRRTLVSIVILLLHVAWPYLCFSQQSPLTAEDAWRSFQELPAQEQEALFLQIWTGYQNSLKANDATLNSFQSNLKQYQLTLLPQIDLLNSGSMSLQTQYQLLQSQLTQYMQTCDRLTTITQQYSQTFEDNMKTLNEDCAKLTRQNNTYKWVCAGLTAGLVTSLVLNVISTIGR